MRRGTLLIGAITIAALTSAPYWTALADDKGSSALTVQKLLYSCEKVNRVGAGFDDVEAAYDGAYCIGVARGVSAIISWNCSLAAANAPPFLAANAPPSLGSAIQAFVNWARANPEAWGESDVDGMAIALALTFPCPLE